MPTGPQRKVGRPKGSAGTTHRRLADRFPTYEPPKGMENLVTTNDISKLLGVRQAQVSTWINRSQAFPTPKLISGQLGRGHGLWDLDEVSSWHEEHIANNPRSLRAKEQHAERRAAEGRSSHFSTGAITGKISEVSGPGESFS